MFWTCPGYLDIENGTDLMIVKSHRKHFLLYPFCIKAASMSGLAIYG